MKSVMSMIVVFIGLYVIAYNDIMGFFAHKTFFYIAAGLAIGMLLAAAAVLGTPFSKPLIKRRGDDDDQNTHLN